MQFLLIRRERSDIKDATLQHRLRGLYFANRCSLLGCRGRNLLEKLRLRLRLCLLYKFQSVLNVSRVGNLNADFRRRREDRQRFRHRHGGLLGSCRFGSHGAKRFFDRRRLGLDLNRRLVGRRL